MCSDQSSASSLLWVALVSPLVSSVIILLIGVLFKEVSTTAQQRAARRARHRHALIRGAHCESTQPVRHSELTWSQGSPGAAKGAQEPSSAQTPEAHVAVASQGWPWRL